MPVGINSNGVRQPQMPLPQQQRGKRQYYKEIEIGRGNDIW